MAEVIKSAAKWHFLHVLNLDPTNQSHQALYWIMKVCLADLVLAATFS